MNKEALEHSQIAVKELSNLFEKIDKAKKTADAVEGMSKLAKASKALGAASVAMEIGLAVFGPEDPKEVMLKQMITMLADLQKRVDTLQTDMKRGFRRVIDKVNYLSAEAQVFHSMSEISGFRQDVSLYLEGPTKDRDEDGVITPEERAKAITPKERATYKQVAKDRILRRQVADLETALIDIERSCVGSAPGAENILAAAIADSHADFSVVNGIGAALLSSATCAHICAGVYGNLEYEEDPKKAEANQRQVNRVYGKILGNIAKAVSDRINECASWKTVKANYESKANQTIAKLSPRASAEKAARTVLDALKTAYPNQGAVVSVIKGAYDPNCRVSANGYAEIEKTYRKESDESDNASPLSYRVWVLPVGDSKPWKGPDDKFNRDHKIWRVYWLDGNLHRLAHDYAVSRTFYAHRHIIVSAISGAEPVILWHGNFRWDCISLKEKHFNQEPVWTTSTLIIDSKPDYPRSEQHFSFIDHTKSERRKLRQRREMYSHMRR